MPKVDPSAAKLPKAFQDRYTMLIWLIPELDKVPRVRRSRAYATHRTVCVDCYRVCKSG